MHLASSGMLRLAAVPAVLATLLFASAVRAQNKPAEVDGIFVTVPNPINEGHINRIRTDVEKQRTMPGRNLKIVIFDFNPDGKNAATESYGPASELADYIQSLTKNGVTPVAWVHGNVTRHTVLPVLACEELTMASGSAIGQVWSADRAVTELQTTHYLRLAGLTRAGAVLKMIDRDVKLVKAKLKGADIFVDLRKVEGPAKDAAYSEVIVTDRTPLLGPGVQLYDIGQATRFLRMTYQADDRAALKEKFRLSDTSDRVGRIDGQPRGCRIVLQGPITMPLKEQVRRQIESAKAQKEKENTFFFVLETSSGGDPQVARDLADLILELGSNPNDKAHTIAFIPDKAPDLAIFVALACHDIFMYMGSDPSQEAVLGDFSTYLGVDQQKNAKGPQPRDPNFIRQSLGQIAEKSEKGIPPVLLDGLFYPNIEIVRATNHKTGETKLMTADDLKGPAGKDWGNPRTIKPKGVLLKFNASLAKNERLVRTTNNKDITEVYRELGLENAVRNADPSWLDDFAAFLRRPGVSILLVIVGIAGLVLELKAPGLVIPGVIAAVCFILFFWAQTQLGGQLIYLAIMLFLLGLALLGIEIFLIPGFGVTGVCGILLILCGLVLAGLDKAPESSSDWVDLVGRMLRYGLTMAGAVILAFILSRFLPSIPYANRLMLRPPEDRTDLEAEPSALPGVDAAAALLGQVGMTTSMLRPSGTAKFGDRYIDVVTEGDFIAPGTSIQVVEVEGTRIVVKKV
jgi:membrane-bound serine protease (ClpP class)